MDNTILKHLAQLESVLGALTQHHETLLGMMKRQRDLLRAGDHKAVTALSRQESELVQAISQHEKVRLELVADLTLRIDPEATEALAMRDLAERLPEPQRGRLLVLRTQLRERIQAVRDESSVTRLATQTLVRHLQGLVQSVAQVGASGAAYGAQGTAPTTIPRIGNLNLTA